MPLPLSPPFVSIDLERTGFNADRDAIIEVAAVRFKDGEVIEELQRLVRPTVDIPLRVQQITGLDATMLAKAPPVAEVMAELRDFVGEQPVVGQSIGFDLEFLRRHGGGWRQPAIDTFEMASILVPEARRYGLGNLVELLGLPAPATHRALDDARAHMWLFEALLERARQLPSETLTTINRLAERAGWPLGSVFALAARTGSPNERAAHPPAFVPPNRSSASGSHVGIDEAEIEAVLSPGGALAARHEGYEDRPAQREMLRHVTRAFNESDQVLVEAGTGTGKSLAYLLPAAAWAMANGRPVVVATHTIPLQDQLLEKDLPLVGELLGGETKLKAAVLKGRGHYLCRTRLARLVERDDLTIDDVRAATKLMVWAPLTRTGDRAELLLLPEDERVWRLTSAEGDGCRPERCRHAAKGDCWLHRARARAETAHVLVVNHALLISDVLTENRLLPRHRHLIVDEAHHLEDVATSSLGFRATATTLHEAVAPLASGGRTGFVPRLREALRVSPVPEPAADDLRSAAAALQAEARSADRFTADAFAAIEVFYKENDGQRVQELRLSEGLRHGAEWLAVEQEWDLLRRPLGKLRSMGAKLQQALVALEDTLPKEEPFVADLAAALREISGLRDELDRVIGRPESDDITWLAQRRGRAVALHRAPLHVGDLLARRLFGDKQTLVLTSATMRAPDFDFVRDRLGLPDAAAVTIASPFDYAKQCMLLLPANVPEPNRPGYDKAVASAITALARATQGRTLALFTSHTGLRQVYHAIRGPLGREGIAVIGQGMDGSRHNLLSALREPDGPTVLLGTRSFWEGVDVPGEALSCLVIARLPFAVPSDPVYAARAETFDEPFIDYAVPQALLRFRQGFGRLVRTASDRGVVAVLDGRVRSRGYGDLFVDALPACQRFDGDLETIGLAARRFLAGEPSFDDYAGRIYNSQDI